MRTGCFLKHGEPGAKGQKVAGRAGAVPARAPVPQQPHKVSRAGPRLVRFNRESQSSGKSKVRPGSGPVRVRDRAQ